jgi:hypothetical protein
VPNIGKEETLGRSDEKNLGSNPGDVIATMELKCIVYVFVFEK